MLCLLYQGCSVCVREKGLLLFYLKCFFILESLSGCPDIPAEVYWARSSQKSSVFPCGTVLALSSRRPLLVCLCRSAIETAPWNCVLYFKRCLLPFFIDWKVGPWGQGLYLPVPVYPRSAYCLLTYSKCWLTELFLRPSGMNTLGDKKMPKMSILPKLLNDWPFKLLLICLFYQLLNKNC